MIPDNSYLKLYPPEYLKPYRSETQPVSAAEWHKICQAERDAPLATANAGERTLRAMMGAASVVPWSAALCVAALIVGGVHGAGIAAIACAAWAMLRAIVGAANSAPL